VLKGKFASSFFQIFKHAAPSQFFSLQNAVLFYNATFFGCCMFLILYTGFAKICMPGSGAKKVNTLRTGDEFSRLWRFFFTTLKDR
jgi:hypothetical protein